ncbi:ESX secretion-associated protein EspG [Amycolatopsis saalfeldensis]|uniref:EspG family protein n=1 Tax=Amycolatopsis saalfeldensis TaxID=394193 RepID=A0A1H8YQ14_9PSEU|nr:ESX secretion-associated protein EspG [Amycolatopsis saalfeldensis]SEP54173.1 EspG family protein [Amycolatopsis saalfeldensis]
MRIIDGPVRMPRPVFLVAWQLENLGEPPPVVGPDATYMTEEFQTALRRRAFDVLARLGLASDKGLFTAEFCATLATLAHPQREFYSWSSFRQSDEDDRAMLVSAVGRDAVRLATDHRLVQLDPIPSSELAESLIDTLPQCDAARVRRSHVSKVDYDYPGRRYDADPLAEQPEGADELRELMRADRDAVHQLYAAVRDASGYRTRSTPLSAIDLTGRGRVLTFLNDGADGEMQINVYPGHRRHLVDALDRTAEALV